MPDEEHIEVSGIKPMPRPSDPSTWQHGRNPADGFGAMLPGGGVDPKSGSVRNARQMPRPASARPPLPAPRHDS